MAASVSVVMPYYNDLDTVQRSIESVIAQTLPVHELIIVDDASVDSAALSRLLGEFSGKLRITLVTLSVNAGAAHARNIGIAKACAKYIAFLDADDVWFPEKIEVQYAFMEQNSYCLSAHGYVGDLRHTPLPEPGVLAAKVIGRAGFCWGNPVFTPTVMALREGFVRFDERYRRVDDYKCWFENLGNGNIALLNRMLAGGFKPGIGSAGLTESVRGMHKSYVEVLRSLYAEDKMTLVNYSMALFVEYIKYPVRSLLVFLRK